jgi:diguanylate cyclase (GGDEF)-like protein
VDPGVKYFFTIAYASGRSGRKELLISMDPVERLMRSDRKASYAGILLCTAFLCAYLPLNAFAGTTRLSAFQWIPWPGIITGSIIIASVVFLLFHWQQQQFRKKAHQLENLVSARTLELAMANADLERLSVTDPLTGLKNRRFVEFSIVEDLARARRSYQCIQGEWQSITEEAACINFLIIDIDHFKEVNDLYGHQAGDQVLRQIGSLFSSMVRESDTVVRWGGEEFLIVARNPKGNDLSIMAERIRKKVESTPFAINDQMTIPLTCSIGFSSWPFFKKDLDVLGWEDIIGIADRGLYMAKKCGRNTWFGVFSHPDYQGKAQANLINDLALAEKQGIIRIQSIISLDNIRNPQPPPETVSYPLHIAY